MRKRYLLILALLVFICGFTLKKGNPKQRFFPTGTVKVDSTLFFDKTEISNANWLEYTEWLKTKYGAASENYNWSLPDTKVWRKKMSYCEAYVEFYFKHPAYRNYPVVGVSYQQALDYCQWRTDREKEILEKKQLKKHSIYIPKKFIFRLPSKSEWEKQAEVGFSDKLNRKFKSKYKGKKIYNLKYRSGDTMGVSGALNDDADITAPVVSYFPNKNGIYNLIGNVEEMVYEKGIAKGGSWKDLDNDGLIVTNFKYQEPESWLGFRCVCEIIEP